MFGFKRCAFVLSCLVLFFSWLANEVFDDDDAMDITVKRTDRVREQVMRAPLTMPFGRVIELGGLLVGGDPADLVITYDCDGGYISDNDGTEPALRVGGLVCWVVRVLSAFSVCFKLAREAVCLGFVLRFWSVGSSQLLMFFSFCFFLGWLRAATTTTSTTSTTAAARGRAAA